MTKHQAAFVAALLVCSSTSLALAQQSPNAASSGDEGTSSPTIASPEDDESNESSTPFKGVAVDGLQVSLEGAPEVVRQLPAGAIRDLVEQNRREFGSYTFELLPQSPATASQQRPKRAKGPANLTIHGNGHLDVRAPKEGEPNGPTFTYHPLAADDAGTTYRLAIWPVRQSDGVRYRLQDAAVLGDLSPREVYELPTAPDDDASVLGWRVVLYRHVTESERRETLRNAVKEGGLDRVELGCFPWSAGHLVSLNSVVIPRASADQILQPVVYGGSFETVRSGLEDGETYFVPVTRIPSGESSSLHWRIKSAETREGLYGGGFQALVRLGLVTVAGLRPGDEKGAGRTDERVGMVQIWAADAPPERLKLPCGEAFKTAWNASAADLGESRDRTEFVQTNELETGEAQTIELCHEIGCHEPKKVVGRVTAVPRERWWKPTAFVGLSRGFHHDLDDPALDYEYERASATGGPQEVYQLRHDRTPLQSVMLSLSLGTTLRMWEGSAGNQVFLGVTPLTFSGVTFRVLPQLGFTGQWRIYEHLYAGTHLMWRRVERLVGDEEALRFVTVPRGQTPPDVLTDERWELFVYFGLSLDLAPVTDEVFEAVDKAFGGRQ